MKSLCMLVLTLTFSLSAYAQVGTNSVNPQTPQNPAAPAPAPAAAGPFGQQKIDAVPGSTILFTSYKVPAGSATQFFLDQAVFAEKTIAEAQGQDIRTKDPVLRKLINSILDLKALGKGALVNYWEELGKTKKGLALRDKYIKVFAELVEENYLERVRLYFGGKYQIVFTGEDPKSFGAVVKAKIKKKDVDLLVEFIMRKTGNQWLVVDSKLDETSLQETYRGSFNRIIRKQGGWEKGIPELLRVMDKRLSELKSGKATRL